MQNIGWETGYSIVFVQVVNESTRAQSLPNPTYNRWSAVAGSPEFQFSLGIKGTERILFKEKLHFQKPVVKTNNVL